MTLETETLPPPTGYLRVSYSSLNSFEGCKRKFEFDKLYPRASERQKYYASETGSALHAGYQNYLVTQDEDQAIWAFMREFPFELELMEDNDYRSFYACLATLTRMFEEGSMNEYEIATIINDKGVEVPAIEVPFELRFDNYRLPDGRAIAFTGYIDAIMRSRVTGLFRTMDIKTTRAAVKDASAKFKFDSQQLPYGVVVEHISQASVEEFEVLYLDAYIDLLNPECQLYEFRKTQRDVQEWITNKIIQFEQIQRFSESDYFPRTDSGCMFWNRPCKYLEPCGSRDREGLTEYFLLGEEPLPDRPFDPWVVANIGVE